MIGTNKNNKPARRKKKQQNTIMSGRWPRNGPKRITLVWRNDGVANAQPMRQRTFQLATESLRGISRLFVVRALVFVATGNWAIHERALLALSVAGQQAEAVGISDPGVNSGRLMWSTCTCVLPATGDLGVGSFAFVYEARQGRVLVAEGDNLSLDGITVGFDFPLYPSLSDSQILQCVLEVEAE